MPDKRTSPSSLDDPNVRGLSDSLREAGDNLEQAVKDALAALEQHNISARQADEFIRECVFNAWWDWDYEGPTDE